MSEVKIPIKNIFYLLTYAWDYVELFNDVKLGTESLESIDEFYAKIVLSLLHKVRQTGIYRSYKTSDEFVKSPRGKINLSESIKFFSLPKNAVICSIDDLSMDNHENRIIKATIADLLKSKALSKDLIESLKVILKNFEKIGNIYIQQNDFSRIVVPRNLRIYPFLLSVCELIYNSKLPNESVVGTSRFTNFIKDKKLMPKIFESFVRNFYKAESTEYSKISASKIKWDSEGSATPVLQYLPEMRTDITLENDKIVLIIDAKFYPEALKLNEYGTRKLHSSNLYQILTYVSNRSTESELRPVHGMLLYPTFELQRPLDYILQGHKIRIASIDLCLPWQEIHRNLLSFVNWDDATVNLGAAS